MGETTQWCDRLIGDVVLGGGIIVLLAEANSVDLLVDLRSVVVTICEEGYHVGGITIG